MSKNLIKNRRFKEGSKVKILHTPLYEGNSISVSDASSGGVFIVSVQMEEDLTAEQMIVGDIAAFGFGAGVITSLAGDSFTASFPNSTFPSGAIHRYVGTQHQNILFFNWATPANGRITSDFNVNQYEESVEQATFGYTKNVYNLQTDATLLLSPTKRLNDGELSAIIISKGFVLKSCDDELYDNSAATWLPDFPLELSGTSIDPIFRRAYLKKRDIVAKKFGVRSALEFKLIG